MIPLPSTSKSSAFQSRSVLLLHIEIELPKSSFGNIDDQVVDFIDQELLLAKLMCDVSFGLGNNIGNCVVMDRYLSWVVFLSVDICMDWLQLWKIGAFVCSSTHSTCKLVILSHFLPFRTESFTVRD